MGVLVDEESANPLPFNLESCQSTLTQACKTLGLRFSDSRPIRLGENAIFHLPSEGLVARIARGLDVLDDVNKELAVARWLTESGLDTAAPASVTQPVIVDSRPITFWYYIEHEKEKATASQLGETLRVLHGLTPPASLNLPRHEMFGRVDVRIASARAISEDDRSFLRLRATELRERYVQLRFPLKACAVHGDAHVGNLLPRVGGGTALIDLERFAFGQPETDLAVTAAERLIGWHTASEYARFVEAYGFDVLEWDGFATLQAIGELKMTTWLMQNLGHSSETDREIRLRLDDLRYPERPRHWTPM